MTDVDRMTREEIEAVWLDVKRLYEHSVPTVYPAAYERLRKPFDLARQAIDRDAMLEDQTRIGQLIVALQEIIKAPGGGPAKRIATLAIERALKREPSAAPQENLKGSEAPHTAPSHRPDAPPAVSAPDVAEMVKRIGEAEGCVWNALDERAAIPIVEGLREAAALLARLGQEWVPVAWMVTWNGETTDDIFCIKGAAIECMARRNRDYPNDTRTIVPLAIISPSPGASDE